MDVKATWREIDKDWTSACDLELPPQHPQNVRSKTYLIATSSTSVPTGNALGERADMGHKI
jgi:hypothetical protein